MQYDIIHSERRRSTWWFEAQQGRRQLYLASVVTVLLGLLIGFIAGQFIGPSQASGGPNSAHSSQVNATAEQREF